MLKFPKNLKQIGVGHRSGWPYVMDGLKSELESPDGILFDDFVERTHNDQFDGWTEPWVGFWHHPPNQPRWFNEFQTLDYITSTDGFSTSQKHLKANLATSEYLAANLRERFPNIPCEAIKHPTSFQAPKFDINAWKNNGRKMIQVGWYLRNFEGIYQVVAPNLTKIHLRQNKPWIDRARANTRIYSPFKDRLYHGKTLKVDETQNKVYDGLLSQSLVFLELFDTSANNAVIEAIVRNTPVVTNRHPATVEYLGKDYPLFFDDIDEVAWLTRESKVREAWLYLSDLDKTELTLNFFIDKVTKFIESIK